MPGVASDTCSRILEGLELKSFGGNSDATSVGEEALPVGRNEMCEAPSLPHVSMEPEATVHGVDHSLATEPEFAKGDLVQCFQIARLALVSRIAHCLTSAAARVDAAAAQLQAIEPSTVAGDTADTDP